MILIASLSGLAYALGSMALARMRREEPIPFGPFLAVGGWLTLMFRDTLGI